MESLSTSLARLGASSDPLHVRARKLLQLVQRAVGCDAAWVALVDPLRNRYLTLASVDLDESVVEVLDATPMHPEEGGSHSADALATHLQRLGLVGVEESAVLTLVAPGGRAVGIVALLFPSARPPSAATRWRLAALAPVLALGVDPVPCLLAIARLVEGVAAGCVLRDDGLTQPLPGLDHHALLGPGSPLLTTAFERIEAKRVHCAFLWPVGGRHAPSGHVRVTVLAAPGDLPRAFVGLVLLSPAGRVRALTPRELEVLGLVVDGCSNQKIAETLVVAPRTAAAHVEHLLVKLDVATRTLAAVRAEREGLYVPPPLSSTDEPVCGERGTADA